MKHLKKFRTKTDLAIMASPNVILLLDTNEVLYNVDVGGVFIQHIDGNLYVADEWSARGFSNDEANGVAVIAKEASFVIAKEDIDEYPRMWIFDYNPKLIDGILVSTDESVAITDFAGKQNTELMLQLDTAGAAYCCANYTFPNGKKGYLPALGEFEVASRNYPAIRKALNLIGGTLFRGANYYWSSTQATAGGAWYSNIMIPSSGYYNKISVEYVRAFTTL